MISEEEKKQEMVRMFCAFCRRTLRNAWTDIVRKQARDAKRETLFSDMREEELNWLTSPYSVVRGEMLFEVLGSEVLVLDTRLGCAIGRLSEREQAIILLYYFAEWTDKRISAELGCPRSTVQFRRTRALSALRECLEEEEVGCLDRAEL
ncbi:sigma-70 family RNA polymerase sigma factor [Enterococcus faecalis]|nr:sigma-70 family RNA polymerase sigma factor [Enterococcus faecalis]